MRSVSTTPIRKPSALACTTQAKNIRPAQSNVFISCSLNRSKHRAQRELEVLYLVLRLLVQRLGPAQFDRARRREPGQAQARRIAHSDRPRNLAAAAVYGTAVQEGAQAQ